MSTMPWPWPDFAYNEISCRHCRNARVSLDAMNKLQAVRDMMARPLVINSAYRCPEHNAKVGGSELSFHLLGEAFDVSTIGIDRSQLRACAEKAGFTGFGTYDLFMHMDIGPRREWTG